MSLPASGAHTPCVSRRLPRTQQPTHRRKNTSHTQTTRSFYPQGPSSPGIPAALRRRPQEPAGRPGHRRRRATRGRRPEPPRPGRDVPRRELDCQRYRRDARPGRHRVPRRRRAVHVRRARRRRERLRDDKQRYPRLGGGPGCSGRRRQRRGTRDEHTRAGAQYLARQSGRPRDVPLRTRA
ncbi:hypothetical protein PsYK624_055190 [Phanerochaete sordida]|uniref:Uncharacterized protein n=1 Tax=Phanerochaete sordida TaxID=48140 RepID=A0A9P3G583_9APHY|nr:hypothetical protein PsYK624_055190 [Phanerochaete sordida]